MAVYWRDITEGPPLQSILGQIGNGAACVVPGFQFSYHCMMKDFLGLPLFLFPSGVYTCHAVMFLPRDKSDFIATAFSGAWFSYSPVGTDLVFGR